MKLLITPLLCALFLLSCTSKIVSKHYLAKAGDISADIVLHGIEIECFKFENSRWPNSFNEMIHYQPKAISCLALDVNKNNFWEKYPTAIIQEIDDKNALIIINETFEKGKLRTLAQPLHINYTIEYERHFLPAE